MNGQRSPWGAIFLVSGLVAMVAVPMALGSTAALPYAVASCLATTYAGFRIWRAAHPAADFWRELSRRTLAVIGFAATVVAFSVAGAFPQVVLIIVGVWLVLIVALFAILALAERTSR